MEYGLIRMIKKSKKMERHLKVKVVGSYQK